MEELITLKKVNIIGMKYIHCFQMDNGDKIEVECTKEDYDKLAIKNPVNPTIEGGKWVCSMGKNRVDTPTGDLSEGEYFEENGQINAKLEDGCEHIVKDISELETKKDEISSLVSNRLKEKIILKKVALPEQIIVK